MKFHSLMTIALLLLAFDSGAVLLHPEAFPAPRNAVAAASSNEGGSAGDAAGPAVFFHDAAIAAASEAPSGMAKARHAQEQTLVPAAGMQAAGQPLPEPLSLSLLGLGFALLGWTRRRGKWLGRLTQCLRRHLFPWPALCWLD